MQMRKSIFSMLLLYVFSPLLYADWDTQFTKHHVGQDKSSAIIAAQYQTFQNNQTPKIADDVIKSIPINESGAPLIDISAQNNARIMMLPNPVTPFEAADKNSGFRAASMIRVPVYEQLNALINELDILSPEFGFKPGQISIRVFEGLRDIATQDKLFTDKANEIKLAYPEFSEAQVIAETSKWVSPTKNNIPAHSTGAAIDIRLYDETAQEFVDLGKFGVIWGANPSAPTFSKDLTEAQIANRLFLLIAASNAGLTNYPYEYWHFSSGDRYATYWRKPVPLQAVYGSVSMPTSTLTMQKYENINLSQYSPADAISIIRKHAKQGNAAAQMDLALSYGRGYGVEQDYTKTFLWMQKAATQGYAPAQREIGFLYTTGRGVKQNYKEAMVWALKAANQGNALAQNDIAIAYQDSLGVKQNYKEALRWYHMAAANGLPDAYYNLSVLHFAGNGVTKNKQKSLQYLQKAAEMNHAVSQMTLAKWYEKGIIVKQDDNKALLWYARLHLIY